MKRKLIYCLLFFIGKIAFSQVIVKGKVLNQENYKIIPYANVGIINTTVGDITDYLGNFKLSIPDSLSHDNLTIHSPGFEKLQININQLLDNESNIFLKPKLLELDEIVINSKNLIKQKEDKVLVKEKASRKSFISLSQTKSGGSAIAVKYKSPAKESFWLNSVKIKIKQNLGDTLNLRIRILRQTEDGTPGDDLYPTDTIVSTLIEGGWLDVDLKNENILIDEPYFFVCYELIEDLPTRIKLERKREENSKYMYSLYDQGVKKIQIQTDSIDGKLVRTGWSSTLSKKEAKKYGIEFSTGKAYFTITPDKNFPTYLRSSSFDIWKPLFDHDFALVSGVSMLYTIDDASKYIQPKVRTGNNSKSYPLVWGSHRVGFKKLFEIDSSRLYKASFYEDGSKVSEGTFRPIQVNLWYPTNDIRTPLKLIEYVRTLAWAERKISITKKVDEVLIKSLTNFGFPYNFTETTSNAQLNANFAKGEFPLIIYTPGLSSDAIENYKICELLASYGYIVVSIPSLGASSREMVANLNETTIQLLDIDFTIKWAKKNLPINNQIGLLGYSWGALSNMVYFFNNREHKIDAMISLDGSIYTQSDLLDAFFDEKKLINGKSVFIGTRQLDRDIFRYYDRISSKKTYYQTVGMQHDDFITLGNDLNLGETKEAYADLCTLIVQVFNTTFYKTEGTKFHYKSKYIHQLD